MSTFETLIEDLTRDVHRAQPKDALQFCASWFQSRLEEQRIRMRDVMSQRSHSFSRDVPSEIYIDIPLSGGRDSAPASVSPFTQAPPAPRASFRASIAPSSSSPFGTLNVPGNALLANRAPSPRARFQVDGREVPPTSPFSPGDPFAPFETAGSNGLNPSEFLQPPNASIFARRASVSAESISVDALNRDETKTRVFPKTPDQMRRIQASTANNFIFRDLTEEQKRAVFLAMQEMSVDKDTVVIRQGDDGDYFYIVESGLLHCFIRPEPLPPSWKHAPKTPTPLLREEGSEEMFLQADTDREFGKKVAEYPAGTSFGELALMYGHARAATVLSIEPSSLWKIERRDFRHVVVSLAHKRRSMYEQFLSTVTLLSSLDASERSKIADALVSRVYEDGQAVVKQGETGDTFFFVEEGEASVTKRPQDGEDGEEITVGRLKKGDYFGELSLLRLAPRAATVSAVVREDTSQPKLKVAALDAPAFTRLLGPLREIMERKAGETYGR
ncbi:putative cyclic AMP-dependent protein kinase regulatory subunit [Schizophyllum fasciatum]